MDLYILHSKYHFTQLIKDVNYILSVFKEILEKKYN